jgi:hypothetical protein
MDVSKLNDLTKKIHRRFSSIPNSKTREIWLVGYLDSLRDQNLIDLAEYQDLHIEAAAVINLTLH